VLAFLSYALFGIAAVLGDLYLSKSPRHLPIPPLSERSAFPADRGEVGIDLIQGGFIEGMQYKAILIGYCLFTMSIIFGGIWAYLAWGTYWLWTPKELWTSILWMYYGFFLHTRLRQWWMGRPLAYLSIAGFAVVLFTYLGVSLLMKSSHSF